MANYRPGELDKRVTIQRETRTPDRLGGATVALVDVATVWAHVRPKSGRESLDGDRVNASAGYLIVIRYRENIFENDRVLFNGEQYNIRAIMRRGGRDLYLELDAERGVAQ